MYQPTITNDEINEMPVGHFPGRLLVVDSEESMREAESLLQGERVVGYDTESRPSFEKGIRYGMSLVQKSTGDTALLFRVQMIPLSENICKMLSSPDVLKIGAALRDDIRCMRKVAEFIPAGFFDLQSVVKRWGVDELSVKKMSAIVLGIKISKAQRLTNWEAVRLTESQLDYAAMDAWVCREIYLRLRSQDPVLMEESEKILLQQQLEGEIPSKRKSANQNRKRSNAARRQSRRNRSKTDKKQNIVTIESHDTTDSQAG